MDTLCFCGGSPVIEEWVIGDQTLFALSCERCELKTDWFTDLDLAEDGWVDLQSSIEKQVNGD